MTMVNMIRVALIQYQELHTIMDFTEEVSSVKQLYLIQRERHMMLLTGQVRIRL